MSRRDISVYNRKEDGTYYMPLQGGEGFAWNVVEIICNGYAEDTEFFLYSCGPYAHLSDANAKTVKSYVSEEFWPVGLKLACAYGRLGSLKTIVEVSAGKPWLREALEMGLQLAARHAERDVVKYLLHEARAVCDYDVHANNNGAAHEARERGHTDVCYSIAHSDESWADFCDERG
uniref:Uncharacterized protein n=1 Tax=viral metagenome TaxID=1070528 RepID=A0A6C0AUD3_9ZZZZ